MIQTAQSFAQVILVSSSAGQRDISSLFATTFGGPCWPNHRLQVFAAHAITTFLQPDAPYMFIYSQGSLFVWFKHI